MFIRRRFSFFLAVLWTKWIWLFLFLWSGAVYAVYHFLGLHYIALPAAPLAVLGTAVSFYLGFKGNAAYDRLWEARKIWGGIVNSSRTWGVFVNDYISAHFSSDPIDSGELKKIHIELIYRHIAWLAALRTQLRRRKPWEIQDKFSQARRSDYGTNDTSDQVLRSRIAPYIKDKELDWVMCRQNQATQLLARQSRRLRELRQTELVDDFRHMELGKLIEEFYTLQGKCERIKNFPLPRQYATANKWFVVMFVAAVPLTLIGSFENMPGQIMPWLAIPVSTLLGWVFLVWDRIIEYSENPFEGLINDVPIDSLARTIEIDLRDMLQEESLPPPLAAQNGSAQF